MNGNVIYAKYNIVCDAENALLIDRNDRIQKLPRASSSTFVGHGQKSVWYTDKLERQVLKNNLVDYILSVITQTEHYDEYKYHFHDESKKHITSTSYIRRSKSARDECIRLKGCRCNICGFDFEKEYGELGKEYIEVHHITPIGTLSLKAGYEGTNPQNDLIPLCSNCHSMIHRKNPPLHPDELRNLMN
ncbi:MAG: HNH endonuclease [Eubacteriales bacterium]